MSTSKPRIAVVGLGRMGANMARHLQDCDYPITCIYDILPETSQQLAEELGSVAANSPSEVSSHADIILTVVTDDASMRELFTPEALLSQAEGKVFINCATISPGVHVEVETACAAVGAHSLEACMASSISQAREGKLYLMIGGKREVFDQCESLLKTLSTDLRYIGGAGEAAKVKALVNMVMNINTAALAEGLGLGEALGLETRMLCEVFAQTGANSRVLETDADDMIDRDHECWFSAAHAAKDSGIANALASDAGISVPLSKATEQQYQRMIDRGLGELDKSGIAELTFPGRS